jgi:hypothetical protein
MNEFSDYLKHIKILLKDFRAAVEPYLDETLLTNKQAHLESIENTISNLNQGNIQALNEHITLKLKIIHEIEQTNEAINGYQEFINILNSYMIPLIPLTLPEQESDPDLPNNEFSPVLSKAEGNFIAANQNSAVSVAPVLSEGNFRLSKSEVTLSDIIQANIIPSGTVIVREFKNKVCRAIITEDGKITLKGSNKATYPDPHSATKAITGLSMDGWHWWYVFIDKRKRPLDDLRRIYHNKIS